MTFENLNKLKNNVVFPYWLPALVVVICIGYYVSLTDSLTVFYCRFLVRRTWWTSLLCIAVYTSTLYWWVFLICILFHFRFDLSDVFNQKTISMLALTLAYITLTLFPKAFCCSVILRLRMSCVFSAYVPENVDVYFSVCMRGWSFKISCVNVNVFKSLGSVKNYLERN